MKSLSHILKRKEVYRKEALQAVEAVVVNFLTKHPIITELSWQHGDEYNDEEYYYVFSNLLFRVAEPLHTQLWAKECWMDETEEPHPYRIIPDRYEKRCCYKTPEELPAAYADGRLGAAIDALKALNEEFRELDAELMTIFGTRKEASETIIVTVDGIQE